VASGRAASTLWLRHHQSAPLIGAVVRFYNQRGKAEQYIKEGKHAINWRSCPEAWFN
jgi:hypothetical protein